MASAGALYTPEVLALATGLARFPLTEDLPLRGDARSQSCGSMLEIGLALDGDRIAGVGLRSHACAIGQAAAAVFAAACRGRSRNEIAQARDAVAAWLSGGALPDWPGLATISKAADYPARHGAVLLPWHAALSALPSTADGR